MAQVINLIEAVKKHPMLYDPSNEDFKNLQTKEKIWEDIGAQFDESAEETKKKWKNLKDSYTKYLRASTSISCDIEHYKKWQWAQYMDVFRPFIRSSPIEYNFADSPSDSLSIVHHLVSVKTETESLCSMNLDDNRTLEDKLKISSNLKPKERNDEHLLSPEQEIDVIFTRYAQTVKAFSPRMKVVAKLKLAQAMSELELQNQGEDAASISSGAITSSACSPKDPAEHPTSYSASRTRKRKRRPYSHAGGSSVRKFLYMLEEIDEL